MKDEVKARERWKHSFPPSAFRLPPFLFALLILAAACGVGQQQRETGIPEGAQATIDRVTADIEAGRDEKIYTEASEEWRRSSKPEQSKAIFEMLRLKLGRAKERARKTVHDEQKAGGAAASHHLVIRYETKFERGDGMETFTLVERDGRWLLAGYLVNSDALKQ